MVEEIKRLKEEKDVVILAHYYVDGKVQEIADFVGSTSQILDYATSSEKKELSGEEVLFGRTQTVLSQYEEDPAGRRGTRAGNLVPGSEIG